MLLQWPLDFPGLVGGTPIVDLDSAGELTLDGRRASKLRTKILPF